MFEAEGPLAIVQPTLTLIGLVALPIVWTLAVFVLARIRFSGAIGASSRALGVNVSSAVAIFGAGGTLLLTLLFAIDLALRPRGYVLVQHVSQVIRLGQLDLAIDFALDPRSATFAIVVALVACASVVQTCSGEPGRDASVHLAWTGLMTAGAMLLCVGDGVVPVLLGLGLLSCGAWGLYRGGSRALSSTVVVGNVSVLLGFVFLFWSLGGTFGGEGYDPDGAPRFVLVTTNTPGGAPELATLSMTTHAGALVSSDDADLPNEPIAAPFTVNVEPGIRTLRVQGGVASGDVVVPRVVLSAGKTHVLTPYGPTVSLRSFDDQIAVARVAPTGQPASVRGVLASRTIAGFRASAIVLLFVLGGSLVYVYGLSSRRGPSPLVSTLEVLPAPYFAVRLAPLVDPISADGALVALLGVSAALVLGARAASIHDPHAGLRGSLAASTSVALAASGLGEPSATLTLACAGIVATSAALAAVEARRDARWLGVACAATTTALPGAGASFGYVYALDAALGAAATGSVTWAILTCALAAAFVLVCTLVALSAFRVYGTFKATIAETTGSSRVQGVVVIVLTVVAVVGGVALGSGTSAFGGQVIPIARRLTIATPAVAHRAIASVAVLLTLLAAASGVAFARRAMTAASTPSWLRTFGYPYAILAWTARGAGRSLRFLVRAVDVVDREIVSDIGSAIGSAGTRAAEGLVRGAGLLSRQVDRPLDRVVSAISAKLELNDPLVEDRVSTFVVVVMVVLLGMIVLSSLFLG